jgi:hypothetical protein
MEHMKLYIYIIVLVYLTEISNRAYEAIAPFDISVRYTRTMIYIASSAPFDISARYTRTMI